MPRITIASLQQTIAAQAAEIAALRTELTAYQVAQRPSRTAAPAPAPSAANERTLGRVWMAGRWHAKVQDLRSRIVTYRAITEVAQ